MRQKKKMQEAMRGWLPNEQTLPNSSRAYVEHSFLLRLSSSVFPIIAIALIAAFCYTSLLVFYNVFIDVRTAWILLAACLVGIEVAIVGATIRTRLKPEKSEYIRKPLFIVGLTFLTASVFGFIFHWLFAGFNMTYPFSVNSWLVRWMIYLRVDWVGLASQILGFAGGFLLLASGAFSSQSSEKGVIAKNKRGWAFYIVAVGASIALIGVLLEEIIPLLPTAAISSYVNATYAFYAFLEPLGIICLTFGWATFAAAHSRRSPFLVPVIYAATVAMIAASFLIFLP